MHKTVIGFFKEKIKKNCKVHLEIYSSHQYYSFSLVFGKN